MALARRPWLSWHCANALRHVSPSIRGIPVFASVAEALDGAARRIAEELGGRSELGPSEFRDVLGVTRKHLIPLLNYFDGLGVTIRHPDGREVPRA